MLGATEASANITAPSVDAVGSVPVTSAAQTSERRCENPDCNVNKLISMVPKRKTTQFISEPLVMDKPMLVNGFTAVFQVDGKSAKLMDIKNPNGDPSSTSIYRIVPNSHVHVVNYVVVDTDEAYLKKITDNDPATMQKLLTTQKDSADQMLKKIMNGQGPASAATTTVVSTINPVGINRNLPETHGSSVPLGNMAMPSSVSSLSAGVGNRTMVGNHPATMTIGNVGSLSTTINKSNKLPLAPSIGTSPSMQVNMPKIAQNSPINLPVRMHPNLKITAVASGDTIGANVINASGSNVNVNPPPPFIQPVPLASLQSPSPAVIQQITKPTISLPLNPIMGHTTMEVADKPTYDKMQEEINDLRRTVAMLAEAQAKNQTQTATHTQVQQPGVSRPPMKRPRIVPKP
ncbi:uncharacterized protein LOC106091685 [Stomoxys calcitrans]|uniref:uncharacterized protein LOC106091685 n=1 Tax=Stomoxys calcitrans TaxID=35570 RepID=UPI0027E29224|nr:uncharacterized protein LOC106091685 [Stomoxys calcitrans]XP_059222965.1 uncharacterized protein LOC106091685 [Stomoxys calcitrans]